MMKGWDVPLISFIIPYYIIDNANTRPASENLTSGKILLTNKQIPSTSNSALGQTGIVEMTLRRSTLYKFTEFI